MVARNPGKITPLLIHGPTSVGKTHLLEGIWTAVRKAGRGATAVYLSAEQFTSQFLEALRGSGLPSFRRKYRGVRLLILDDLQFLAGKRATQVELLHTIDTLLREGRQLVFAADRPPAELDATSCPSWSRGWPAAWSAASSRPTTPRGWGSSGSWRRRLGIELPADVQRFVASRLTGHARELSGAICRLQATSEALRQKITLALAEEALGEMIQQNSRVVRLGDIEKAVCKVFGLEPASLQSDGKSQPRQPSADAGHVAGPEAHPRRPERDRRVLRPPQPQHGDFRAEAGRPVDGRRRAAAPGRADLGDRRGHPPGRAAACPRGSVARACTASA